MKILLLGKNGQVGWELQRSLAPLGELFALGRGQAGGLNGDLSQTQALAASIRRLQPQVIVNAAAYTAVDLAESEPEQALAINRDAVGVLAREARLCKALLVHYSTDYVFDGSGERPWREDDAPAPLNVYGRSKWQGEQAIAQAGCQHLIFRTSWVYAARGGNFAKTILRLAAERDTLSVVSDQWGAPTGAELLADVTAHAIVQTRADAGKMGLYHVTASGQTHWCAYARYVIEYVRSQGRRPLEVGAVRAVATADWPTPAPRPLNSRLDTQKFQKTFGLHLPDWRRGVDRMLDETSDT